MDIALQTTVGLNGQDTAIHTRSICPRLTWTDCQLKNKTKTHTHPNPTLVLYLFDLQSLFSTCFKLCSILLLSEQFSKCLPSWRQPVSYGAINDDAMQAFGIPCLGASEKEVEQPLHLMRTFEKRQLGQVIIVLHKDSLLIYLIFSQGRKGKREIRG